MSEKTLSSEQVFDMLPHAVDIYDKLDFDNYRKELVKKYKKKKDVDYFEPALDAIKHILKNAGKIKNEIFEIVAIAENKSIEEVKNQSFIKTLQSFKNIFSDPELVDFFKGAMQ